MNLPLEKNTAGKCIALCQEVTQNPCGVSTTHLVGGQTEVHAFENVHEDCWDVVDKSSGIKTTK